MRRTRVVACMLTRAYECTCAVVRTHRHAVQAFKSSSLCERHYRIEPPRVRPLDLKPLIATISHAALPRIHAQPSPIAFYHVSLAGSKDSQYYQGC